MNINPELLIKLLASKLRMWGRDTSLGYLQPLGVYDCLCVRFSVDYSAFDTINIIDTHKYLMKKHDIKYYLG